MSTSYQALVEAASHYNHTETDDRPGQVHIDNEVMNFLLQ